MIRMDGKEVSGSVYNRLKDQVNTLKENYGVTPGIAVVIIGEDPASQVYVRNKVKKAEFIGAYSEKYELPANSTQQEVIDLVKRLNTDEKIHGILVQSPPPPQINEREIIETINPSKDVDCFHPYNVGKLLIGDTDGFAPCTPSGIVEMIAHYNIETSGKHAVIVGRSNIVGKPMAALLVQKAEKANCTTTICHSRTKNLPEICSQADILIAAIGSPQFITANMVKDNAVVIDVGMNRIEDASKKSGYRLVGDVDYEQISQKAAYITPVPGGVGLMTIAMLMQNTVKACCANNGISL